MRRPDGVTVIAIYHFLTGALGLLGGCAILVFAVLPIVLSVRDETGLFWSLFALGIGILVAVASGIISLIVAVGLVQLRPWARWAAIVLAVLGQIAIPIGTIIGALIIWYQLQDEARIAFESH